MPEQPIHILIADDHPVFRFGLRALLESQADIDVVGEAANGEEAVRRARLLKPDLVLMDVNMPELNGIEATRRITAAGGPAVLIFTMFDDDTVFAAMQAGARGYLLKGAQGADAMRAIRSVAEGEVVFSPGVAQRVMAYFARGAEPAPDAPFPDLTPAERRVLELVAQGLTNSAIAERLVLSPKTIRNQVSSIYGKLQVAGRSEAVIKARAAGLGREEG